MRRRKVSAMRAVPGVPGSVVRGSLVAIFVGASLAGTVARAGATRVDTSAWKCTKCVFYSGAQAKVRAGVLYADGADAASGRYDGINRSGAYADAGGSGRWRTRTGAYGSVTPARLGLDTRRGRVTAGEAGMFQVLLTYQGQPFRQYDATRTPYRIGADGRLVLPADWVTANTTSGMTALGSSLDPVHVGTKRRIVALSGTYFVGGAWSLFAKFSHSERTGTQISGASFLTEAVQVPEPIDYRTNEVAAGENE